MSSQMTRAGIQGVQQIIPVCSMEMVNVFYGPKDVDQGNSDTEQKDANEEAHPGHITVCPIIKVDLEPVTDRDWSRLGHILVHLTAQQRHSRVTGGGRICQLLVDVMVLWH